MRELIAQLIEWALPALTPRRPGRHSAEYLRGQAAEPAVNPWSRPWTGPSAAQVRAVFHPEAPAGTTPPLSPAQRERRYAVLLAELGVDYPYSYEGAPFGPHSFRTAGVCA